MYNAAIAARRRRPYAVTVRRDDEAVLARLPGWLGEEVCRGPAVISLLAVPLLKGNEVLGALNVSVPEVRCFSDADIRLLQTFADQAVTALENARLIDEIRIKSAKLGEANRHKSAFVASTFHELRTLLNVIIGYSEMLQEEAEELGEPAFARDLACIGAAGKHLLSLINTILDLSKIEAGKMEVSVEEFLVKDLLVEVEAVAAPYKPETTPTPNDIAQVTSYAVALDCHDALLVYPALLTHPFRVAVGSVRVGSIGFSLQEDVARAGSDFLSRLLSGLGNGTPSTFEAAVMTESVDALPIVLETPQ